MMELRKQTMNHVHDIQDCWIHEGFITERHVEIQRPVTKLLSAS